MSNKNNLRLSTVAISIAIALTSNLLFAADAEAEDGAEDERVVILGSRAAPRSVADSPVPVDLISSDELGKTGSSDMLDQLVSAVPSFSVRGQPISDAATLIRPVNLRGLSSDSTLILVNGKRRHRAAVIAFLGGGINDGAQGPDISVIPSIALAQVEVLRDGAAAQYGSDAIAGVMNFVLKDDADGGSIEVKTGEFFEGDGASTVIAGNIGLPLTRDGFVNLSFQLKNADPTSRSVQNYEALQDIAGGNPFIQTPVSQVWGNPEVKDDITIFANVGIALDNDKEFYMFGNYSERDVTGGFYFRSPTHKSGVFVDGNGGLLIGDMTPDDGIGCPAVPFPDTGSVLDTAAYQLVADDPNCWAFHERFPGGFTPSFGGNITDTSLTVGTKGDIRGGFLDQASYDLSGSVGRSEAKFFLNNTVNPSLGANSPVNFKTGTYIQLEKIFNADLIQSLDVGLNDDLDLSLGAEWKEESFETISGQQESWEVGVLSDQGFGIGTNGFPGFSPRSQGTSVRRNISLYADAETNLTDDFMLGAAIRYEDYTSFGDTTNFKLTTHYSITDQLAFRASISTGFRAPSVGQANVVNTQTTTIDGALAESALFPPTDPLSVFYGGTELTPEESESYAFGLVYQNGDFFLTADYYNIEIIDRVSKTLDFNVPESDHDALRAIGIENPQAFSAVSYFTNDFDTTTSGVDLVANYKMSAMGGETAFSLAYNWNETTVDRFDPDTSDLLKIRRLEDELPHNRATFTIAQSWDDISAFVRTNFYGSFFAVHADGWGGKREAGASQTIDLELSYFGFENIAISVGASNLFDNEPEKVDGNFEPDWWQNYGGKYFENSPFDYNGGYYYAKVAYNF